MRMLGSRFTFDGGGSRPPQHHGYPLKVNFITGTVAGLSQNATRVTVLRVGSGSNIPPELLPWTCRERTAGHFDFVMPGELDDEDYDDDDEGEEEDEEEGEEWEEDEEGEEDEGEDGYVARQGGTDCNASLEVSVRPKQEPQPSRS